ncbi:MAG: DMT family transporter [Planctomycetaceae bacterium]|nr:DMT family transporter [Planctomycetaceae bacterium]
MAAFLFALGALLLKRAAHWQIDTWRTSFVSNLSTAIVFLPLLFVPGTGQGTGLWWQPVVVGALFVLGQVSAIIALTKGEVSVAAPVLGLKIVMVALFAWLITGRPLPPSLWIAAALATVGVMLLNVGAKGQNKGSVQISVVAALFSAMSFSLFDVCVQIWTPAWGLNRLLPLSFVAGATLSLPFIFLFKDRLRAIPTAARSWLAGGCLLIALQSLAIVMGVALSGQAAVANVFYSTRGLWGVILAWGIGPLLGVPDGGLQGRILWFRLGGATLLMLAVTLLILA